MTPIEMGLWLIVTPIVLWVIGTAFVVWLRTRKTCDCDECTAAMFSDYHQGCKPCKRSAK